MKTDKTYLERFWAKVQKTEGCWLWTASLFTKTGYGQFYFREKTTTAHRAAYELLVGPIPDGYTIHHRCHVRACVNPDHLELVEAKEHGRLHSSNFGKTHCDNGHEFTPENTYVYPEGSWRPGSRRCRICQRAIKEALKDPFRPPNAQKTHCPRGHEYTEENIYRKPSKPNSRQCRECMRLRKLVSV